jgi:hypothetical protein
MLSASAAVGTKAMSAHKRATVGFKRCTIVPFGFNARAREMFV